MHLLQQSLDCAWCKLVHVKAWVTVVLVRVSVTVTITGVKRGGRVRVSRWLQNSTHTLPLYINPWSTPSCQRLSPNSSRPSTQCSLSPTPWSSFQNVWNSQAFTTTLRRGVAWIFFFKCMRFHLNIRLSSSCIMLLKKTLYTAVHLSLGYTLEIFIIFFNQYILLSYNFYVVFSLFFLLSNSYSCFPCAQLSKSVKK